MQVSKVTPIQIVERIEPLLELWEERLGFTRVAGVPDGDRLGFALLARGEVQVMLQTTRSLASDLPAVARLEPRTILYVDVASLDDAVRALDPASIVVPPRTTFYGAREVFTVDRAGNVLGFAEHAAPAGPAT